jgi:hypothetical protein
MMVMQGDADLLEVVETAHPIGRLADPLNGGKQQRHQQANDGNYDEQFNQRESSGGSLDRE